MCMSLDLRFYFRQSCVWDQGNVVHWIVSRYEREYPVIPLLLLEERLVSQENRMPSPALEFQS